MNVDSMKYELLLYEVITYIKSMGYTYIYIYIDEIEMK